MSFYSKNYKKHLEVLELIENGVNTLSEIVKIRKVAKSSTCNILNTLLYFRFISKSKPIKGLLMYYSITEKGKSFINHIKRVKELEIELLFFKNQIKDFYGEII